ncbi:hypothetical protein GQ44DRAFT_600564 [Phaeosphaeriaceae sp. PMI808]|nr:hypothetical protein GQ44DRAFT_600564 [Phaeosphaeriaceae sp. PMI808]
MGSSLVEGQASGSQIPLLLRQKMLNRAVTFTEGARLSSTNLSRRRSSLLSNLSDTQQSCRSSTDNLPRMTGNHDMNKLLTLDESSFWHSTPVFIAIVPAIAALTHPNGGTFATDIVLLILSAWLMHKCATVPWQWYHEARRRQYVNVDEQTYDDVIQEEDEESVVESPERPGSAKSLPEEPKGPSKASIQSGNGVQSSARDELKRTEIMAFVACLLGPLLGAYFLHHIRAQFTHTTRDGIVTDLNLTIYVLAAEARPISRLSQMVNERTLRLQRIVRSDSIDNPGLANVLQLMQRVAELEAQFDGPMNKGNVDVMKVSAEVRQGIQHQLDALNRAVRKYEKRQMAQSIQIEARFQEVDVRLQDTLSLAAAAARTGQKPGIASMTISWVAGIFTYGLHLAWDIVMYPFRIVNTMLDVVRSWFFKNVRHSKQRAKGQINGAPRLQSRSGR